MQLLWEIVLEKVLELEEMWLEIVLKEIVLWEMWCENEVWSARASGKMWWGTVLVEV